jgi:hypothetical protein
MPTIVNGIVTYIEDQEGTNYGQGLTRILWKLLVGWIPLAGWTGPKYPNASFTNTPTISCGTPGVDGAGCLYNLDADPTEHVNLASNTEFVALMAKLFGMIQAHNATTFTPNRGAVDPNACKAATEEYKGF